MCSWAAHHKIVISFTALNYFSFLEQDEIIFLLFSYAQNSSFISLKNQILKPHLMLDFLLGWSWFVDDFCRSWAALNYCSNSRAALNDKLTIEMFICLWTVPEQHKMTNNIFCSYSTVFVHLNGFLASQKPTCFRALNGFGHHRCHNTAQKNFIIL